MLAMISSLLVLTFVLSAQAALQPCDVVGQLKADSKYCDQFYQCTNSGWVLLVCQSGLFFNPKISVCDWPDNVICGNDNDDDDQSKLEPCETVGLMKADSKQCDNFYQCTEKGWSLKSCTSPLLFNPKTLACDSSAYVNCGGEDDHGDADNDDHSGDADHDDHSGDADHDDHSGDADHDDHSGDADHDDHSDDHSDLESCETVGQMKADSKQCGNFYQCTDKGWLLKSCTSPLLFNPKSLTCDGSAHVTCGGEDEHNDDHSGDADHDDHSGDADHDDHSDDHSDLEPCNRIGQMKGDGKDCQIYYICTEKGWTLTGCRSPLLFNSVSLTCDYALYVTCAKDN